MQYRRLSGGGEYITVGGVEDITIGGVEVVRSAMLGCGRKWGQLPMGVMQCCNQSQGEK